MKKIIFIISLIITQVIVTNAQAFILQTQIKDATNAQVIPNQEIKSTWAAPTSTNEHGQCILSFVLNGDENFLTIDYTISDYYPAKFSQVFVPINWRLDLIYEIELVPRTVYESDFRNTFLKIQEKFSQNLIVNKQNFILNSESFLFVNYLLTSELLQIKYTNSLKLISEAFNSIENNDFNAGILALDSEKINFYRNELDYELKELNEYAPNYIYSLHKIKQKQKEIDEAEKLKEIFLFLSNKASLKADFLDAKFLQSLNSLLNSNYVEAENLFNQQITENTNPYRAIQINTALALIKHLEKKHQEASDLFSEITNKYFTEEEKKLQFPLAELVSTYTYLTRFEANKNIANRYEFQSIAQNFNQQNFVDIDWLKLIIEKYLYSEENISAALDYDKEFITLYNAQKQTQKFNIYRKQLNFVAAKNYLEQEFQSLIKAEIPYEKIKVYLIKNIVLQAQNYTLNLQKQEFGKKISSIKKETNKFNDQQLANGLEILRKWAENNTKYTSPILFNDEYAIFDFFSNLNQLNPNGGFSLQKYYEAETSINSFTDENIKLWCKLELTLIYTEYYRNNNPNEYTEKSLSSYFLPSELTENDFFTQHPYFKNYLYEYYQNKVNFLISHTKYENALNLVLEQMNDLELNNTYFPTSEEISIFFTFQLAQIYYQLNQFEAAYEQTTRLGDFDLNSQSDKTKFEVAYLLAKINQHFEQYERALKNYNEALSFKEQNTGKSITDIAVRKSEIYYKQNNLYKSNLELESALKLEIPATEKIKLLQQQIPLYIKQNQFDLALSQIEKIESFNQYMNLARVEKMKLHNAKINIYIEKNNLNLAIREIRAFIFLHETVDKLDEQNELAKTYFYKGKLYQLQNKTEEAIEAFTKCINKRKIIYEHNPGEYEVEIAYAMLKIADVAYNAIQTKLTQDLHKIGQENAGLAVSILKNYNRTSPKIQLALIHASELRAEFEKIIW